ncbi:MAG: PIN domain-containing protein, partial [Noviherbaspirillum sp.]
PREERLPQCRDKDDQKFLELARDAGAAALITKDKALLKLAGKARRAGLFAILTPQAWQDVPGAQAPSARMTD